LTLANRRQANGESIRITISKKFCDISHLISEYMPVYPGDPRPKFESVLNLERDKVNLSRITLGAHTGTHVDSQKHFFKDGNGVEKESLCKFIGEAIVLDFSKKALGEGITDKELSSYSSVVNTNDILLLYTGVSNYWHDNYMHKVGKKFTYIHPSAADWIINQKIKSVGIDTFSVEQYGSKEALTHKKLLSSGIGIIENLNSNLKKFVNKRVFLVCLPLALEGLDASPARTILFDISD
jgi:arylformamidase